MKVKKYNKNKYKIKKKKNNTATTMRKMNHLWIFQEIAQKRKKMRVKSNMKKKQIRFLIKLRILQ